VSTRANLGADCVTLRGYPAIPMDPSQTDRWLVERVRAGRAGRSSTPPTRSASRASRPAGSVILIPGAH
jgi:hypothetical protein